MKRITILLLLALLTAICLTGCGGRQDTAPTPEPADAPTEGKADQSPENSPEETEKEEYALFRPSFIRCTYRNRESGAE